MSGEINQHPPVGTHMVPVDFKKGDDVSIANVESGCVDRIPDITHVRRELARNVRERELLSKLLRLAQRKAAIIELEREPTWQEVSRG